MDTGRDGTGQAQAVTPPEIARSSRWRFKVCVDQECGREDVCRELADAERRAKLFEADLARERQHVAALEAELSAALHAVQPGASVLESVAGGLGWHRLAEHLMGQAEMRQTAGERLAASWCWRWAGECERQALRTIGPERPRTAGIIAESARWCAEHARRLLADDAPGQREIVADAERGARTPATDQYPDLARERRRVARLRDALAYIAANQNRMSSVDAGRIAANALASDAPGQGAGGSDHGH